MSITSPLRERKKQRTRERLYDSALELFAERPYGEVTVDEICERAEVGRATYFRFYGSKGGLLVEFNRRLAQRIQGRIDDAPEGTATDQLWMVQDEIACTWGSSGPAMREMAREYIRNITADDFAADAPHPEVVVLVADIVRRGQAAGEFARGQHPRFVAWIVVAALSAITAGWLGTGDDDTLAHGTHDALELLLGGLRRAGR